MRRLIRPAVFAGVSSAALVGFVLAGRLSTETLSPSDPGGWLDRADPIDALVEIARWLGFGLAVYVVVVSMVALFAETAGLLRMVRVHRWLHRLVDVVALPALRRRLLELTTVATITAASLHAMPAGAAVAPAPSALIVETTDPVPLTAVRGEFHGFGLPVPSPAEADPSQVHTVTKGETLSQIIRDHYGRFDARLLRSVVAANPQIHDPNLILVGWSIVFPDDAPDAEPAIPPTKVRGEATWSVVTVQRGDTLWDIVDRHYGHATSELVWATVDANPDIDDPNLIYPGQQITLPPATNGTPIPVPTVQPEPMPPPVVTEAPAEPDTPPPSPPEPGGEVCPTAGSPALPPPNVVSDPTVIPSASPTVAHTDSTENEPDSAASDESVGPSLAQLIGWTGGAGLAAAVLRLAARRRRRLPPADRARRPSRRSIDLGIALRETENLSTVEWAAGALRTLATRLRPRPGEPTSVPRLLRLAGDHIEVVWDTPNTESPAPWHTPDGGWSWTLDRTTDFATSDNPSPCPCFVTIGRRDGADVLLNLESCGAIAITGVRDAVDALWRSVATELAGSAFADAPTVLLVGVRGLAARPDHSRGVDVAEAIGWLRDRTDAAGAILAHRRLTSLFALRARSRPQDVHEPVVVVVDPDGMPQSDLTALLNLANGDLGAVVVVLGSHPTISWRITCGADVTELQPLGLALQPVGLPASLDRAIEEIVPDPDPELDDDIDDPDFEVYEPELALTDHLGLVRLHEHDRNPDCEDVGDGDDKWDVELKVLGQVRCLGTKQPLTPTELHLAIYLAFHRHGENSDTLATMVWPKGAATRTITNTMASLRRKLGTGSDGQMLFPLGRDNQYVYRLSTRVVTDWDRFIMLTRQADALPPDESVALLDEALELIDGPPFRAPSGYSWAYSDGTATLVTQTVRAVARRCVELHLERSQLLAAGIAARKAAIVSDADCDDDPIVTSVVDAFRRAEGLDPSPEFLAASADRRANSNSE